MRTVAVCGVSAASGQTECINPTSVQKPNAYVNSKPEVRQQPNANAPALKRAFPRRSPVTACGATFAPGQGRVMRAPPPTFATSDMAQKKPSVPRFRCTTYAPAAAACEPRERRISGSGSSRRSPHLAEPSARRQLQRAELRPRHAPTTHRLRSRRRHERCWGPTPHAIPLPLQSLHRPRPGGPHRAAHRAALADRLGFSAPSPVWPRHTAPPLGGGSGPPRSSSAPR